MTNKIQLFGKNYDYEYIASIIFTKRDELFGYNNTRDAYSLANNHISYPYFKGKKGGDGLLPSRLKETTISYTPYDRAGYCEMHTFLENGFKQIDSSIEMCLLNDLYLPKEHLTLSYTHSKGVHIRGQDIEKFITDNNINLNTGLKEYKPLCDYEIKEPKPVK